MDPFASGSWNPPGRSAAWRLRMALGGVLLLGLAALLWWRPQILIWLISGLIALLGVFCLLSALLARGGGGDPEAWRRAAADESAGGRTSSTDS